MKFIRAMLVGLLALVATATAVAPASAAVVERQSATASAQGAYLSGYWICGKGGQVMYVYTQNGVYMMRNLGWLCLWIPRPN